MSHNILEMFVPILLALLALAVWGQAGDIRAIIPEPMGPAVMPRIGAGALFILSVMTAVQTALRYRAHSGADDVPDSAAVAENVRGTPGATIGMMLAIIAYYPAILIAGYFTASFLLLVIGASILSVQAGKRGMVQALVLPALFGGVVVAALFFAIDAMRIYTPPTGWF